MRHGVRAGLLWAALLGSSSGAYAQGQKHALLIGIGDYIYGVPALEGPPFDIRALQQSLTEHWAFPPANIRVLLDKEATKAKILAALDSLVTTTKPSDFLFIYFSGHGTSSFERGDLGMDGYTGAVVPADLDLEAPDLRAGLIVGSRDLRPRLEKLDKDRQIFVVFDSCYSGAAVRSLRAVGRPRYVPMPTRGLASAPPAAAEEAPTAKAPPYPYQNVVYISAASRSEAARDVTSVDIRGGRARTVDSQPHGALTNALLEGLSGSGDTNHDGVVSYGELYEYMRDRVTQSFPQQPQLLLPEARADAVRSAGILNTRALSAPPIPAPRPAAAPRPGAFRVKLEKVADALEQNIRALPGVAIADGAYDLLVAQERDSSFTLFHESGDVLASFASTQSKDVVERVARQGAVKELIDLGFPDQDFNLSLTIPGNRGFLKRGEQFTIDFSAEKDSYILLLDVDSSGYVSVLFPFNPHEIAPGRQGRVPPPPDSLKVSPPFGTEYLKIFAFREKPEGFEKWMNGSFSPLGPELRQLIAMLKAAKGSKAQNRLKVVTRESAS